MTLTEVINKLFCLRGANRVEIVSLHSLYDDVTFQDTGTGRVYSAHQDENSEWEVFEVIGHDNGNDEDDLEKTKFAKYFEGILAGKTRNDAGELV